MTDRQGRFIAVGIDGSPSSRTALAWAAAEAKGAGVGLKTILAWNYPLAAVPGAWGAAPAPDDMATVAETISDSLNSEVLGDEQAERVVRQGKASHWLLEESRGADLLVTGRRGSGGMLGVGLGSTSKQVATHADLPVAIVGEAVVPSEIESKVLVAVDGSDHSIRALVWAMEHVSPTSTVIAVYSHDEWILDDILDETELAQSFQRKAENRLADIAADAREAVGPAGVRTLTAFEICVAGVPLAGAIVDRAERARSIDLRVVHGDPRTTVWHIAAEAEADVVVVGARGRTGISGAVLGSFTTYAATHCPETTTLIVVP